jgi:hypothetical protein
MQGNYNYAYYDYDRQRDDFFHGLISVRGIHSKKTDPLSRIFFR